MSELHCDALNCRHNTANRSHGESAGLCDYKHVTLSNDGTCEDFELASHAAHTCLNCAHYPADNYKHPCDECCYKCKSEWEAAHGSDR